MSSPFDREAGVRWDRFVHPGRSEPALHQLSKLRSLTGRERSLLFEAAVFLGSIRVLVVYVPFRKLRGAAEKLGVALPRARNVEPHRIAWAVEVASRYVPGAAHCLTQALAGQAMLARSGLSGNLRIGLARAEDGTLRGHAWLEREGTVLIGGAEAPGYTIVQSFRGRLT